MRGPARMMVSVILLLSIVVNYQQVLPKLPDIYVTKFEVLEHFQVPYFDGIVNGTHQRILLDTGVQTFVLDMSKAKDMPLEWDGSDEAAELDGDLKTINFVRTLPIKWNKFKFSAQFGLAYDYSFFKELDAFGSLNPSQMAHHGCILIDFPEKKITVHEYGTQGADRCIFYNNNQRFFEFSHNYRSSAFTIGKRSDPHRTISVAIDTGYSRSVLSNELSACDGAKFDDALRVIGFGHVTSLAKVEGNPIYYVNNNNNEIFITSISLCQEDNFTQGVDLILGYDFLKDKVLLVGKDLPPRILIPDM